MNNDVSNQNPEGFDSAYTNAPIYLLARYKAYCDLFENDEKKHYEEIEGLKEE